MCLMAVALEAHPDWPLVVAANRDEYEARPTAGAHWWHDLPGVWAGRDLHAGGTWLGLRRDGRFAALTNVREPQRPPPPGARSRGALTAGWLCAAPDETPLGHAHARLAEGLDALPGFNLLLGHCPDDAPAEFAYLSNRAGVRPLAAGVHGVSNATLDVDWPKVRRLKARVADVVATPSGVAAMTDALFEALDDRSVPDDEALPDTGIGLERERLLASAFIAGPGYGTRAATVVLMRRDGLAVAVERAFEPGSDGRRWHERRAVFRRADRVA